MQELLKKYFPGLKQEQVEKLGNLQLLYEVWNAKINVISRKDIENLGLRHVLHSLAIAKAVEFLPGEKIMDAGTGGGFPGIPLAIMFPEAHFTLVDSTAKKLMVVEDICRELKLVNINVLHIRLEDHHDPYDHVISRAVADLRRFFLWTRENLPGPGQGNGRKGLWYLKGGDVEEEIAELKDIIYKVYPISDFFREDHFETKKLVHIRRV